MNNWITLKDGTRLNVNNVIALKETIDPNKTVWIGVGGVGGEISQPIGEIFALISSSNSGISLL